MKQNRILKPSYILITFLIGLFSTACTEKVELDLGTTYTRLVVDGSITSDTMAHTVKLSTTTGFYYNKPAPGVSGAEVFISSGSDTIFLTEDTLHPGLYRTDPDVYGVSGRTYTLGIQLKEAINGNTEYKASCYMPAVNPIDSISIIYREKWKIWEIDCYAWEPPSVDYYMFNTYKNHILMTDTINKVFITDDRLFNGSYTYGAAVGFLREEVEREKINPGDVITVQIAGITREYLYFIYEVQVESGYKNPLISGPPANIKGNISNGAIGFFAAYSTKYASKTVL
ncbi:MAG: DUF4249 family protein [Bacteroidales bacterium]